jgi:5'(3')-deoxyribonucleotidase
LNLKGSLLYTKLAAELDIPYRLNGSIVVCLNEADLPRLNKLYDYNITENDITDWSMELFYPHLNKADIYAPVIKEDFWLKVNPSYFSKWFLRKLQSDGHKVKIVTSSFYQNLHSKMERLLDLFPTIKWQDVIITHDKQMIEGDILIDDRPDNLMGGEYAKILMDKPHNRSFNAEQNGITRVKNLVEAYKIINQISKTEG